MGAVRFGMHDLVNVRFAISPLWESLAAFRAVADPGAHAVHLPWIRTARLLERDLAAPLRGLPGGVPAFLTPPPPCPLAEIEEELALVRATPAERVRADLDAVGAHRLAEEPVRAADELADAVLAWWRAAVQPHWPRVRALLEADIAHRTRQLAEDGIRIMFAGLHPSLRWSGDRLASPDLPATGVDPGGIGLTLTPTAFATRCHLLPGHRPPGHLPPGRSPSDRPFPGRQAVAPALVYPARAVGTLWERRQGGTDGLARLLGRSRAQILAFTSSPSTTTQLAARTGLSLGAVSQHLAVLRDTGLVTGHRYRHEVNYTVSDLGLELIARG
ncbi:ArsR family transcriptional regulator [Streptosporangium sp. CA-135522]|uniref:ArsR/SmtB family transcription factor n=1 Tax=Streptosporangium sp. CA-135522 TaxID=3240072 RepID=UPI003D8DF663